MQIYGFPIDDEGRCKHYHSEKDIVSIKFKCCNKYYPCYQCHEECRDHPVELWKREEFEEKAILCGACQTELTITKYLSQDNCPKCHTAFNPNCAKHYPLYFEVEKRAECHNEN